MRLVRHRFSLQLTNCLADWSLSLGAVLLVIALIFAPSSLTMFTWPDMHRTHLRDSVLLGSLGLPALALGATALISIRRGISDRGKTSRAIAGIILGALTVALASGLYFGCSARAISTRTNGAGRDAALACLES